MSGRLQLLRWFRSSLRNPRAMALPMTVIFCALMSLMVYYMTRSRIEQKRQNLTQFSALQAHFMAQGAVQQALLKFRILPNEAFSATAVARGLCPFYVAPEGATPATGAGKTQDPLDQFVSDVNSDSTLGIPLSFTGAEFAAWHMEIAKCKALTSFTSGTEKVNVVSIEAVGMVPIWVKNHLTGDWESSLFKDVVTKTVEIRRGI